MSEAQGRAAGEQARAARLAGRARLAERVVVGPAVAGFDVCAGLPATGSALAGNAAARHGTTRQVNDDDFFGGSAASGPRASSPG